MKPTVQRLQEAYQWCNQAWMEHVRRRALPDPLEPRKPQMLGEARHSAIFLQAVDCTGLRRVKVWLRRK
ncbi:MAG: hypothetical protein WBF89_17520 [Steroidobacteraceae bacterium]